MSSALLYFAIVAVWGAVLVPMWLRRDVDPARSGFSARRLLGRRPAVESFDHPEMLEMPEVSETPGLSEEAPQPLPPALEPDEDDLVVVECPPRRRGRAAVIARRRRRTSGTALLFLSSVVTVVSGLGPWWLVLPPLALLAGHLVLLRVAAGMDLARRQASTPVARGQVGYEDQAEAEEQAEVIDLVARHRAPEVYDQYADAGLRAVGD